MIPKKKLAYLAIRDRIAKLYENKCGVCNKEFQNGEVHHIIPRKDSGSDHDDNLIFLCRSHHKTADRIALNEFDLFEVIRKPITKSDLIEFIYLMKKAVQKDKRFRH